MRAITVLLAIAVVAASCSGSQTAADYATTEELRAKLEAGGFGCTGYDEITEPEEGTTQEASCVIDGARMPLVIFPTTLARDVYRGVGFFKQSCDIIGPHWLVVPPLAIDRAEAKKIAKALGGEASHC
jgi:hypothetical protein